MLEIIREAAVLILKATWDMVWFCIPGFGLYFGLVLLGRLHDKYPFNSWMAVGVYLLFIVWLFPACWYGHKILELLPFNILIVPK